MRALSFSRRYTARHRATSESENPNNLQLQYNQQARMKGQRPLLIVLSTLVLVINKAIAFRMSDSLNSFIVGEIMASRHLEEVDGESNIILYHPHVCDSVLITVSAWLVFVVVSLSRFVAIFNTSLLSVVVDLLTFMFILFLLDVRGERF